jgi:hypothetical protein
MTERNACLVGTDIEMIGVHAMHYQSQGMWHQWLQNLSGIPDKGERLEIGSGFWCHRDGLSAEFGFAPTTSLDEFMTNLGRGKSMVQQLLSRELYPVDSFDVSTLIDEIWAEPYLDMGCAPDYMATPSLKIARRSVPSRVRSMPIRECSGHIHMSLPEYITESEELTAQFIRELDEVVYPMAVVNHDSTQPTWYRRRYVFRPTPYGVEYRSIGAGALYSDRAEDFLSLIFSMTKSVWEV